MTGRAAGEASRQAKPHLHPLAFVGPAIVIVLGYVAAGVAELLAVARVKGAPPFPQRDAGIIDSGREASG
jgi:hypothetical protein